MSPFPLPSLKKSTVRLLFGLILLISIPAFLINLPLMTFIEDESIRSLVAFEMWYNGDYISPTLNNTLYFKKPPLYNYVLVLSAQIFGYFGELPARVPTLVFLALFGFSVYRFYRPKWGFYPAVLLTGMLLTSGRILFWESMLGLIDMCFSWVIFLSWVALYRYDRKGKHWKMYLLLWLLTTVAFFLKGLPALVFIVLSVGVWFLFEGRWKKIFHPGQFVGGILFLGLVTGYYWLYSLDHDLAGVLSALWSQSSQRTPLEFGVWATLLHLIEFPLEMAYHFLPWSIFLVFLRKKSFWRKVWSDRLLRFHLLMIAGNIWVYWISPEVYPRYLLMFIPFFSALCIAGYYRERNEGLLSVKIVDFLVLGIIFITAIAMLSPLFIDRVQDLSFLLLKVLVLFIAMGTVCVAFYKYPACRLMILVLFLLILRTGFDWFILPERNEDDWASNCREQSEKIGREYRNDELLLWKDAHLYYTNSFYISTRRNKPLERAYGEMEPGKYYIIEPNNDLSANENMQQVDSFCIRHEHRYMPVVRSIESVK